jgi:hypothetical protein
MPVQDLNKACVVTFEEVVVFSDFPDGKKR